jgi:hypothetical protein
MYTHFVNSKGSLVSDSYNFYYKIKFLKLDKHNSGLWGQKKVISLNRDIREKFFKRK